MTKQIDMLLIGMGFLLSALWVIFTGFRNLVKGEYKGYFGLSKIAVTGFKAIIMNILRIIAGFILLYFGVLILLW